MNNVNFADSYEKRKGQIEVQTMHGTPLKDNWIGCTRRFSLQRKSEKESILEKCKRGII
mgnify:CR=1 FL=1